MTSQNPQEFSNWYDSFIKQYGVLPDFDVKTWHNNVENNHKEIRERLGGIQKVVKCELKQSEHPVVEDFLIYPSYLLLYRIIPDFFEQEKCTLSRLCCPIDTLDHNIKWGKQILRYAKKISLSEEKLKEIEVILAKLGEIWATTKIATTTLYLVLDTSAEAFCRLGYYEKDDGSCFANNGLNSIHKFMLGQTHNSFVGFVTNNGRYTDPDDVSGYCLVRFWGFYDHKNDIWHTCNTYPKTPDKHGSILKCMERGFNSLLDIEEVVVTPDILEVDGVYQNVNSSRSYSNKNLPETTININTDQLENYRKCLNCHVWSKDRGEIFQAVDNGHYCSACTARMRTCEFTKRKSVYSRYSCWFGNKQIHVSEPARKKYFALCEILNCRNHKSQMIKSDRGGYISKKALADSDIAADYKFCSNCKLIGSENKCLKCGTKDDSKRTRIQRMVQPILSEV
jgi:hypothetical protein